VLRRTKTPRGSHHLWTFLLIRALRPKRLNRQPAIHSIPHPEQPHSAPVAVDVRPRPRGLERCVSVMWRPFLFRRPHCFGCLCRLDSLRERIDPRAQRLNLLALPIYDIAQFDVGALQEGYFRFQPLDCFAVHFDSVAVIRGTGASPCRCRQLKPNWRYSCIHRQPDTAFQASSVPYEGPETPVFPAPRHISNIATKLPASLGGDVFTCRDRATRVRSRPLVCLWGKT
jgi:hypothetical protein